MSATLWYRDRQRLRELGWSYRTKRPEPPEIEPIPESMLFETPQEVQDEIFDLEYMR